MTKKYVLTGSPGSGKSALLLELEHRGEYTIREAAEDVIKRYQAQGIEQPWKLASFQEEILALQIQREARIPTHLDRIWIDRGTHDGLAYVPEGIPLYEKLTRDSRNYARIFLIEHLGTQEHTRFRREDIAAAQKLEEKFITAYTDLGYSIERIPPAPLEERTSLLLGKINGGGLS